VVPTLVLASGASRHVRAGDTAEETREPATGPQFAPDAADPAATQRRIHSIAHELAATAKRHGKDSVALQAGLLIHSLGAGAVAATEVTVVGESVRAGPAFLEVDVTTGIIMDAEGSTQTSELAHMWRKIAGPTLEKMESFEIQPRGLELVFIYGRQRFADLLERKADPTAPSEQRMLRVAIPEAVLSDLAGGTIEMEQVLPRCTVHDGTRIIPTTELALQ
jgi:hypothetical protein